MLYHISSDWVLTIARTLKTCQLLAANFVQVRYLRPDLGTLFRDDGESYFIFVQPDPRHRPK